MTVLKCELSVIEALLWSKMPLFSGFPAMLLEELQMLLLMMRLHVACLVLAHLFASFCNVLLFVFVFMLCRRTFLKTSCSFW